MRAWITFRCKVERDDEKEFYLSIGSNPLMVLPVSALCAALCVLFAVLVGSNSLANLIWTAILLGSFAAAFIIIAFNIRRHLVYQRKEGKLLMITALRSHPTGRPFASGREASEKTRMPPGRHLSSRTTANST